jgi:serine/threonine-protein kinase HipA
MRRRSEVRLDGRRVGVIEETREGTRFTYDAGYVNDTAQPVSVTLPVRAEPYDWPQTLHPFFMNLLPEGWLLEISTKALKISSDDYFGLLSATCADTIGAVEILALDAVDS